MQFVLFLKPTMVRKTGNPSLSRPSQPQPQGPTNAMVPVGMGGNGLSDILKLFGKDWLHIGI